MSEAEKVALNHSATSGTVPNPKKLTTREQRYADAREARDAWRAYERDTRDTTCANRPTAEESGWKERNLRSLAARDPRLHRDHVRLAQLDKILASYPVGTPEHTAALAEAVQLRPRVRGY